MIGLWNNTNLSSATLNMKEINVLVLYGRVTLMKRKIGICSWILVSSFWFCAIAFFSPPAKDNRHGKPFSFFKLEQDLWTHGPMFSKKMNVDNEVPLVGHTILLFCPLKINTHFCNDSTLFRYISEEK